jgi:hypothetical protein
MAANTDGKQRRGPGRRFEKGQSGNPAGRAKGSRNKATIALQALLDEQGRCLPLLHYKAETRFELLGAEDSDGE